MRLDEYNRILISYGELVPVVWLKSTYDSLKHRQKIDVVGRGCRGNSVEVVYDTIGEHYKAKIRAVLGDPRKVLGLSLDKYDKHDKSNNADKPAHIVERIPFKELTTAQLRVCNARYNLVRSFREYAQVNGREIDAVAAKREFLRLYQDGYLAVEIFEVLGCVSFQTVERWNKELRDGGEVIDALAPARRENTHSTSLTPDQQQLLIKEYLNPNKPTVSNVYRMACRLWRVQKMTDIPSMTAARRFINSWAATHHDIVTLHRDGEKAFKEKCMPHIERDPDKINYLDVLVSDGKVMNFQIVNPDTGRLCRPTMVAWIDARTLQVLGFELSVTENTLSVASSFRAACINAGRLMGLDRAVVPRSVYVDNGRAFKNKALGNGRRKAAKSRTLDLSKETAGLFERLRPYGLQHVQYAKAYNGRTKIIERLWQLFDEIEKMANTYVGNNIENKPAGLMRNETYHKTQRARDIAKNGYPTLWGAYDMIEWFIGEYNNRRGDGKYLAGLTPMELAAKQAARLDMSARTIEGGELNYMLMHSKTMRITANGVKIGGVSYYNRLFTSIAGSGAECIVRYDLRNRDRVLIFHEDGSFWCEAESFVGQNIHPMAALGSDSDKAQYHRALNMQEHITREARNRAIATKESPTLFVQLPYSADSSLPPIPNKQLQAAAPVEEACRLRLF